MEEKKHAHLSNKSLMIIARLLVLGMRFLLDNISIRQSSRQRTFHQNIIDSLNEPTLHRPSDLYETAIYNP